MRLGGETLPKATFEAWKAATGLAIMDGIGATEMLHIFIAAREEEIRPGATGKAVPGYEARVVDANGAGVPRGTAGRLAVRGPTGCRYLADDRQKKYVEAGWNITGDTYIQDARRIFLVSGRRRHDHLIGLQHRQPGGRGGAAEAPGGGGVRGGGGAGRRPGHIVKAYVVLKPGHSMDAAMAKTLQDHVKAEVAPYKYPREVKFVALPKTQTGKLQRFELRKMAIVEAQASGKTGT